MATESRKSTTQPEDEATAAVRRYLTWLENPEALVDRSGADELNAKLDKCTDPLERLQLLSELEKVGQVDEAGIKAGFHRHAARFAAAAGVTPSAFATMGVPQADLRAAGLVGGARKTGTPKSTDPNKSRVGRRGVLQTIAGMGDNYFTIRELEEASGASMMTVRKAVEEMVELGKLGEFDPDENYQGRGRAPRRYRSIG